MHDPVVSPFVFRVMEVFRFSSGLTVLMGAVISGAPRVLAPCEVELIVGGRSRGWLRLTAERMPGPASAGRRAVETAAEVEREDLLSDECLLVHHG